MLQEGNKNKLYQKNIYFFSVSCFSKNYQWEKQLNLLNLRIWPLLTNLNADFQIFKFLKKSI